MLLVSQHVCSLQRDLRWRARERQIASAPADAWYKLRHPSSTQCSLSNSVYIKREISRVHKHNPSFSRVSSAGPIDYLGKESRGAEVDRQARLLHYCSGNASLKKQ